MFSLQSRVESPSSHRHALQPTRSLDGRAISRRALNRHYLDSASGLRCRRSNESYQVSLVQSLLLQQALSGSLKDLSAFPKDTKCPLQRAVDDRSHLGVDSIRGCLAIVVLAMRQEGIGSGKETPGLAVVSDASERLRHPVARDHAACDIGDAAQVIRRTCRKVIEYEEFGRTAAEQHRHLVLEFGSGHQEAVLGGALNGVPQCTNPSRNDRNLVHHIDTPMPQARGPSRDRPRSRAPWG